MNFHTKTKSTIHSMFPTSIYKASQPNSTLISPVLTIAEGMKVMNQYRTKIRTGSVVKVKVGELEKITREGKIRRIRKEVVVCAQDVGGEKKLLIQFEDGKQEEIISSLLVFFSLKYEVNIYEAISKSPEKEKVIF